MTKFRMMYTPDPAGGGGEPQPDAGADPQQTDDNGQPQGGSTPNISPEEIERIRKAQEEQAEQLRQAQQLVQTMAQMYVQRGTTPQSPTTEPDEDDLDFDDDDVSPKELLKRIKKEVRKTMETYSQGILQQVQTYAQQNNQRWYSTERERITEQLQKVGMQDVVDAAERYLRENNITPEVASSPGVFEKAVQLVIGERVLKGQLNSAGRPKPLSATDGAGIPPDGPSREMEEELNFLKSKGIELSPDEWKELRSVEPPVLEVIRNKRGGQ